MNKSITIQPVGSRVSQWGEGPIFWDGHLIYVDIEGQVLIRLNGETGSEETWEMGERIGTVVPMTNGDNAGVAMGVASGMVMGPDRHLLGSFKVFSGVMPATRLTSMSLQNSTNAPGARIVPSQVKTILLG